MTKVYRFEIQMSFDVTIEDDSNEPINKNQARRFVIENLREYVDSNNLSDCYVSDGVEVQ
jgi:hypothetical protein